MSRKESVTVNILVDKLKNLDEFKNMTKKDIKLVIEGTFSTIQELVLKDQSVFIDSFGKFTKVTREGISNGFGKKVKYKVSRVALKPFKDSKIKG